MRRGDLVDPGAGVAVPRELPLGDLRGSPPWCGRRHAGVRRWAGGGLRGHRLHGKARPDRPHPIDRTRSRWAGRAGRPAGRARWRAVALGSRRRAGRSRRRRGPTVTRVAGAGTRRARPGRRAGRAPGSRRSSGPRS